VGSRTMTMLQPGNFCFLASASEDSRRLRRLLPSSSTLTGVRSICAQRFPEQLHGPRLPLCSQRPRARTLHMPSLHARLTQAGFLAIAHTVQGPDLAPR
jgi:hypothetical protein